MEDPMTDDPIFTTLGLVFTYIYVAEAVLKIWALGFIMAKDSYLRDSWNVLDFLIVVTGLISDIFQL